MPVNIRKSRIGGIDLTPMIDVVFQLMIFFLVATKLEEEERELDVVLPQASEARPLTAQPQAVVVNINDRGQYFLNGQFAGLAELEEVLGQAAVDNPGRQSVRIRADKRSAIQPYVTLINLCNKLKIRDVRLETEEPEG